MKKLKILFVTLGVLFLIYALLWISPYNYLIKGVSLTYLKGEKSPTYKDWVDFDLRPISNDLSKKFTTVKAEKTIELNPDLLKMLTKTQSGSYLVYKNDTLISENYFDGSSDSSRTNSFSMAKTITTLLVQMAIQDKLIGSWDDKVIDYLPWIKGEYAKELTLRHLSTMTAGLNWDESYLSPFGITAKAYYSNDIEGVMRTVDVVEKPGEKFEYQSGSTQLLGFVLQAAINEGNKNNRVAVKTISEFAQERLWKRIGAEYPAYWSLDKENGKELSYCCFDATSRDFGKLGLLVMHHGKNYMGEQLVDSSFLAMAQQPYKSLNYGHSFWLGEIGGIKFSYFQGLGGQYIVLPKDNENMVVVRTGKGIDKGNGFPIFDCVKTYMWYARNPKLPINPEMK